MKIFKSKSGRLAYTPEFVGQSIGRTKRDDPQDFERVLKGVALIFILVVSVFMALGFHRHFIGG
jgi:hypothetical protein